MGSQHDLSVRWKSCTTERTVQDSEIIAEQGGATVEEIKYLQ